jgi:putative hydrolase of the HAD superfamily
MPKILLFDVDGVLVIGEPWNKDLARTYDITPDMLSPFFKGPFQACLVGKADLKAELATVLPRCGWPHSVDAFVDYWFRQGGHVLNEPLLQNIQQLRRQGIKCYLATQQEQYRTTYILHEMGFADLFDGMFSSADIGYLKTEPRFFTSILTALEDCQAEDVLFWDDTPANVVTARSTGIQAEVYTDFVDFQAKMQELIGSSLSA